MRKGFSLVELLVVIGLLGVIAAVSLALLNPDTYLKKSRDSRRKADLQQIRAALELYRSDYGHYPRNGGWVNSTQGDSWIRDIDTSRPLTPNYIKTVPKDPKNTGGWPMSGGYTYAYFSATSSMCGTTAGNTYILTSKLENTSDPEINVDIQYGSCSWPGSAGYTGLYTVGSP